MVRRLSARARTASFLIWGRTMLRTYTLCWNTVLVAVDKMMQTTTGLIHMLPTAVCTGMVLQNNSGECLDIPKLPPLRWADGKLGRGPEDVQAI